MGSIVGLAVGVPVTCLLYEIWFNFTTFAFGCAGAAVALSFAESARKILRAEDVAQLKFQSDRKPLNLSSQEGSGEGDRSATGDTK